MSNRAAVANGNTQVPYTTVELLPIPSVPKDAILVKAVAYATNPTDWKHLAGEFGVGTAKGSVAGSDLSGVVEAVGSEVTGFAKGDYVSTWLHGGYEKHFGAFQDFVVVDPIMTLKLDKSKFITKPLPEGEYPNGEVTSFEGAASLALGLSTVVYSLAHSLKMVVGDSANKDKYILIWGGATATGFLAIQVAKHIYGVKVIATASGKNAQLLKDIGADAVVDYKDKDAIAQIKAIGGDSIYYALDTVSYKNTWQSVYDATAGTTKGTLRLDNLLFLGEDDLQLDKARDNVKIGNTLAYVVNGKSTNLGTGDFHPPKGLVEDYSAFWLDVLPKYLPKLQHTKLRVLKAGLESVDEAFTLLREDKVSAEKVVFRAN